MARLSRPMGGATQIATGIWVGDLASSLNRRALTRHGLDGIVSLVLGVRHDEALCNCLHVPVRDCLEADITRFFPSVSELCRGKSHVLFHCSVGLLETSAGNETHPARTEGTVTGR